MSPYLIRPIRGLVYGFAATIGLTSLLGLMALAFLSWGLVYLLARLVFG